MAERLPPPRRMPSYAYRSLPGDRHIRLLKLEPGKKEDYIHCHLEPVTLKEAYRQYECVSYVWGDTADTRRIVLDGHDFEVTLSLFHALQHFRLEDEERTLWADAISIQQTNPPEKGRQVQMMGDIYASGSKTLVWLGPDSDGIAEETAAFIKDTATIARELINRFGSVTSIPVLSSSDNPLSQDPAKWALYKHFLSFAWFDRVWVMQEVGIAADVTMHWGDAEIRLSDVISTNELQRHAPHLFEILSWSQYLHDAFVGLFMWYGNLETWRSQVVPDFLTQGAILVPEPNLTDTLIQSSRRSVTDIRDYIYGLLGHPLAQLKDGPIVQADYEKHVDDVFLQVSAKLLQELEPSLPLAVAGDMGLRHPRDLDTDTPSWTIQWQLGLETSSFGRPGQWHYAGGQVKPAPVVDLTARTVTVAGVIFDRVKWSSERMYKEDIAIDKLIEDPTRRPAAEWVWEALPAEPCRYEGEQGRRDAFTLSLVAARYKPTLKSEDDIALHRKIASSYQAYLKARRDKASDDDLTLRNEAREFETDHAFTAHDRRFIVTERGFYGLGPQLCKEGDVIAVFVGFMIPYILRPCEEKGRYKLVGAAFVQGVMRGEVLDKADPLNIGYTEAKDIVIV